MLADLLPHLRCPVCRGALAATARTLHCVHRHTFDLARAGYAPLLSGRLPHPGDTAAMVTARNTFLASGSYHFLTAALAAAASAYHRCGGLVVDVGGGTGHHLAGVLDTLPGALGLVVDVAKPALRRAAHAHPRAGAVLADTWQTLPLPDRTASLVLNVFAPRNGPELHRILAAGGALLVAAPTPAHLAELAPALPDLRLLAVDPRKPDRLASTLDPWFDPVTSEIHTHHLHLPRDLVRALVAMGPSAGHLDPAALDRAVAAAPEPLPVTASVRLTHYLPRRTG